MNKTNSRINQMHASYLVAHANSQLGARRWAPRADAAGILTSRIMPLARNFCEAVSTRFQERAGLARPREARGPDAFRPSCRRLAVRAGRRTREEHPRPIPTSPVRRKLELTPESRTPRNAADRAGRRRQPDARRDDWPDCGRARGAGKCGARARVDHSPVYDGARDDSILPAAPAMTIRASWNRRYGDASHRNDRSNRGMIVPRRSQMCWRTSSSPTRSRPGFFEKRALPTPRPADLHRYAQSYELMHILVGMQSVYLFFYAVVRHCAAGLCARARQTIRPRAGNGCIGPAGDEPVRPSP